jgi:GMP synthase PP-ATPase subunit
VTNDEILIAANHIVEPYGLRVEFLGGQSVGVQGDARTYRPVIVLVGPFPGWDVLGQLATQIPNELDVNRVTFEFANQIRAEIV